jgi:uncharacterized protein
MIAFPFVRALGFGCVSAACALLVGVAGCSGESGARPAPLDIPDAVAADSGSAPLDSGGEPDGAPPGDSAAPPTGSVRIATYNVLGFFDTVCDSAMCGPNDFEEAFSESKFRAKAAAVAGGMRKTNADVVLLEEVENQNCVDALKLAAPEFAFAHIGEIGFTASMDVVVMSKDPIKAIRTHRENRIPISTGGMTRFTRELLEVDLEHNGAPYTVFVGHFKSQANDNPAQRLAEANAARSIILAQAAKNPKRLIVFGGDLNDTPGSPPINALEEAENGIKLVRTQSVDLAPADQNTYFGKSLRSPIDHLFIPQPVLGYYVRKTAAVVQDAPLRGLGGSDHASLAATYLLAPR